MSLTPSTARRLRSKALRLVRELALVEAVSRSRKWTTHAEAVRQLIAEAEAELQQTEEER